MLNLPLIVQLSVFSTLIPFFTAMFIRNKLLLKKDVKAFLLLITTACVSDLLGTILFISRRETAWLIHIYMIIEFSAATYILASWQPNEKVRAVFLGIIPIYLIIYSLVKLMGWENFASISDHYITRPVAVILLSFFTLFTFHSLHPTGQNNIFLNYRFWILGGMLFYFAINAVIFAFIYLGDMGIIQLLYQSHAFVNITRNLLYTAATICIIYSQIKADGQPVPEIEKTG